MALKVTVQDLDGDVRIGITRFLLATIDGGEHHAHATPTNLPFEQEAVLDHRTGCQCRSVLQLLEGSRSRFSQRCPVGGAVSCGRRISRAALSRSHWTLFWR